MGGKQSQQKEAESNDKTSPGQPPAKEGSSSQHISTVKPASRKVESVPPFPPKLAAEKIPPPPPVDDLDPPPVAAPPPPTTLTSTMMRAPISSRPPPPHPPTNTKDKFGGHMTREDNLPPRPLSGSKNRTEAVTPTQPCPPPELKPPPDREQITVDLTSPGQPPAKEERQLGLHTTEHTAPVIPAIKITSTHKR